MFGIRYPIAMAYNRNNYLKYTRYIVDVYREHKDEDVPDTYIIRKVFPKYGIFISYRKWMYIKNMKQKELPESSVQLSLFD